MALVLLILDYVDVVSNIYIPVICYTVIFFGLVFTLLLIRKKKQINRA